MSDKKVGFLTLGCKVNQYESAAIAERLEDNGFTVSDFSDPCDYYVINTCTVTGEADRKSRQMIRRARKNNPAAKILVTGCLAQIKGDKLFDIEGVCAVVGSRDKMRIADKIIELEKGDETKICEVHDPLDKPFEEMKLCGNFGGTTEERTRAYIKIEDGCDSNCTYCIIPKARGSICSKSPETVIEEVKKLVKKGYLEVVLTGIETGSYGKDFDNKYTLADLLCEVDKIDGLERIRLGSLDPSIMKKDFVEKIAGLKKLCPHFHLSLQSGSERILALMKRKYNTKMFLDAVENIRRHIDGVMFTTDIICGFPDETDEDFADTVEFVKKAKFLSAHIFAYSKREGTPAATMENQVPANVASERVNKLYGVVNETAVELLGKLDGEITTVIPEEYKNGTATGHTPNFVSVNVECDEKDYDNIHGKVVTVKLSVNDGVVFGQIMEK